MGNDITPSNFFNDSPKKNFGRGSADDTQDKQKFIRCNEGNYGCGQTFPMQKRDGGDWDSHNVAGFNCVVNLCLACCHRIAREWGIPATEIDALTFATNHAKVGKRGVPPSREEITGIARGIIASRRNLPADGMSFFPKL